MKIIKLVRKYLRKKNGYKDNCQNSKYDYTDISIKCSKERYFKFIDYYFMYSFISIHEELI